MEKKYSEDFISTHINPRSLVDISFRSGHYSLVKTINKYFKNLQCSSEVFTSVVSNKINEHARNNFLKNSADKSKSTPIHDPLIFSVNAKVNYSNDLDTLAILRILESSDFSGLLNKIGFIAIRLAYVDFYRGGQLIEIFFEKHSISSRDSIRNYSITLLSIENKLILPTSTVVQTRFELENTLNINESTILDYLYYQGLVKSGFGNNSFRFIVNKNMLENSNINSHAANIIASVPGVSIQDGLNGSFLIGNCPVIFKGSLFLCNVEVKGNGAVYFLRKHLLDVNVCDYVDKYYLGTRWKEAAAFYESIYEFNTDDFHVQPPLPQQNTYKIW